MDYLAAAADAKIRLSQLDREREALVKFIDGAEALARIVQTESTSVARRSPKNPRPKGAMEATRVAVDQALKGRGAPMQTRDLLAALTELGVQVGGKDAVATLSARLSNADDFELHRGHGWWFTGQRIPGLDFDEAEGQSVEAQPSASNFDKGGRDMPPP